MIIRQANGSNVALRTSGEWGNTSPIRWRLSSGYAPSGVTVTPDRAFGVPTIFECIRLVSTNVAQLPLIVYDESDPTNRVPATTSWQYDLLRKRPGLDNNSFNLISDISACIEGYGNAFIQKSKNRGKIVDLQIINPDAVQIRRDDSGNKVFDVMRVDRSIKKGLTSNDIIHIRGFSINGMFSGISPIEVHRYALGNIIALQEFTGHYFANDATPAGYISVPGSQGKIDPNQAREILAAWEEDHGGLSNRGRPGILMGGAEWKPLGVNLEDAQFIDGQKFNVEEGARIMSVPVELLQPSNADSSKTEEIALRFLQFYIAPRLERIKAALNADTDLFPNGGNLCADFNFQPLLRADLTAQSVHDLRMRQAGIMTPNEIRATKGLPPHKDGDDLLAIPVGAGAIGNSVNAGNDVAGEPDKGLEESPNTNTQG